MPTFQPNLSWTNGCATDGRLFYFLCRKEGHVKPCPKVVGRKFPSAKDRERFIAEHNATYHTDFGRSTRPALVMDDGERIILAHEAIERYGAELNQRERNRTLDPATVIDYNNALAKLRQHIDPALDLERFNRSAALSYINARRAEGNGGSRIRRELNMIHRVAAFSGVRLNWTMEILEERHGDVLRAERRERKPITIQDALRWFGCMTDPERTAGLTKLMTGVRNEELFAQRVGDVRVPDGGWFVELHVKFRGRRRVHWQPLPASLLARLSMLCEGRDGDDLLFTTTSGLPLTEEAISYRLMVASQKAGLACACEEPSWDDGWCVSCNLRRPIKSWGFLRHMAITWLVYKLGPREAQEYIGHSSVTMTERYNRPELFAEIGLALKEQRRAAAGAMGELVGPIDPLDSTITIGPPRGLKRRPR